jgi:hypothetical protein
MRTCRFRERWLPAFLAGDVHPVVDRVFHFEDVANQWPRLH